MTTQSLDGTKVYTKSFRAEKKGLKSRFKKINWTVIGVYLLAFLLGVGFAGNIMGYAINWSN